MEESSENKFYVSDCCYRHLSQFCSYYSLKSKQNFLPSLDSFPTFSKFRVFDCFEVHQKWVLWLFWLFFLSSNICFGLQFHSRALQACLLSVFPNLAIFVREMSTLIVLFWQSQVLYVFKCVDVPAQSSRFFQQFFSLQFFCVEILISNWTKLASSDIFPQSSMTLFPTTSYWISSINFIVENRLLLDNASLLENPSSNDYSQI